MSFVTLAIVNSALTSIEAALQAGEEVDVGVLSSFNAGITHLLLSGREPGAVEVAALQNLAAAIRPDLQEQSSGAGESDSEPSVADPASEDQPGSGEEGGQPSEEPEAAGGADTDRVPADSAWQPRSEAPQVEVTQPDAAVEAAAPAGAAEELFQPQSHDEDDGA